MIRMQHTLLGKEIALSYMTHKEVSEAIGSSEEYVDIMRKRYVNIRISLYERICRYFRLNWYELLGIPAPENAVVCMETEAVHNKNAVLDHVQFEKLRNANGFTREQLAGELNRSTGQIDNMRKKDVNVPLEVYAKICELFNVQLGSMLTYVDCA